MAEAQSFTLSDLARGLDVPQHRLIHLCEKEVVTPELKDAAGRGSSRRFSTRNYLEFAIALRMRELMMPVAAIGATLRVLRVFEHSIRRELPGFVLPETLRSARAPDLRVIVGDGSFLYFSIAGTGPPKVFGGVPLDQIQKDSGPMMQVVTADSVPVDGFGGPEGSRFGRLELSVTVIARGLVLD